MEDTATCIVAIVKDGIITMGCDSAASNSESLKLNIREDKKIFVRNKEKQKWIFGFTTSYRMGQLIQYSLELPTYDEKMDLHEFMVTSFIPALRTCFQNGGYESKEKDRVSGGCFIVGFWKKLFVIHPNYQVATSIQNFVSVGCGEQTALGALSALKKVEKKISASKAVTIALEAAEQYSAGVRGPFHLLSI